MRIHKKPGPGWFGAGHFLKPKCIYVSDNIKYIYKRSLQAYPDSIEIKISLNIEENLTLFFRNSGFVERA